MLQSMGSQRVRHNWVTELNSTDTTETQVLLFFKCVDKTEMSADILLTHSHSVSKYECVC